MTADFRDRRHGGRMLAQRLTAYADRDDATVLALLAQARRGSPDSVQEKRP